MIAPFREERGRLRIHRAKPAGWLSDRCHTQSREGCWGAGSQPVIFIGPGWLQEHEGSHSQGRVEEVVDLSTKTAGIDTGKKELHVEILPGGLRLVVGNDEAGIARLVEACREAGVERCGIEATSIYHRKAMHALRGAGFAVAELQPGQVRNFAKAALKWDKSDPVDAHVIARLTQVVEVRRPEPDARIAPLAEALTFIDQLAERIVQLKTSRERFESQRILKSIAADVKRLKALRRREINRLECALRKHQDLARRLDLLLSIPCVAVITALSFLIRMPELGTMTREEAARLAGLAPCLDDSAKRHGERHIYGGRSRLRIAAFMAAFAGAMRWNEDLKAFYRRLIARGKSHKAAVTACARKLIILANAILTRGEPWKERRVMP